MKVNLQALLVAPTVLGSMGLHTPRLHYPLRHNTFPLKQSKPASMTALNMAGSSSFGPTATRHLAVAGRIPWHKLLLTKAQALQIVSNIREQTHVLDLGIMFGILAFSQNIVKFLYTRVFRLFRKDVEYDQSVTNQVVENIRQAAGLGLLCYVFDIIEIIMEVAGIDNTNMNFSSLLSKLLYATWAAFRVRTYKRSFFAATFDKTKKWTKVQSGTEGKVEIVDKVTDFFLFGILALIWIDILEIKRGNGLSSIFALGGASTFVITLACQDLAKKVLNGLAISTSDVFAVGDAIQLGDGTSGTVKSVGWLSTEIRGGDEIVTKIPNTQLSNIRVSNLSRMRQSQVKQSLKFRYEDLDKIPDLVNEIREEIVKCCPKVITNGSKPFRVRWTNFGDNHLEVMIDCRLQCPPVGDGYFEAREGIMQAIARAVRRKGAEFVPPTNLRVEMRDAALPATTVLIQDV